MMEVIILRNESRLIELLWSKIERFATSSIAEKSVFRVGLSGGSLIKYLASGAENSTTDWSKWELYFCDERFVDETDEDSTFGQYKKLFIPKTSLNESQFVTINRSLSLDECAKDYERQIFEKFAIDKVGDDAVLLSDLLFITFITFFSVLFSQRIAQYLNLIYFCWEWVLMGTPVHCSQITHCWLRNSN